MERIVGFFVGPVVGHRYVLNVPNAMDRLRPREMEGKDVLTMIALMLGPVIVAVFTLWCALYGWAA